MNTNFQIVIPDRGTDLSRVLILQRLCLNFLVWIPAMWVLRCLELARVTQLQSSPWNDFSTVAHAFGSDVVFVLQLSGILLPLAIVIASVSPKWALRAISVLFALALFTGAGLSEYFASTNTLLGADLFGYSIRDIGTTVSSSGVLTIWTFLPFVGIALCWFLMMRWVKGKILALPVAIVLVVGIALSWIIGPPNPRNYGDDHQYQIAVNKMDYFIRAVVRSRWGSSMSMGTVGGGDYPLYREFPYADVLSPFLAIGEKPPNLVFIIVEGLGRDFVGPHARYGGFTPFLDSLSERSLYWENFLSNTGRTFGVLPSVFGSLPFGRNGFMDYAGSLPNHESLIHLLRQHGYSTSFYYGGNANFDYQDLFLERQGIDYLLDENKFGPGFGRMAGDEKGFSWGYSDGDLFRKSLELIDARNNSPRLDIYLTLSLHEPFIPPTPKVYLEQTDRLLRTLPLSDAVRAVIAEYKNVFSTLLYVDDAIRQFIEAYRRRPDYANTLFIITGDHRLIPVPASTPLDRFRVPLIFSSPLVKRPTVFSSVSSHRDITPSLLALLKSHYPMEWPSKAHWLGSGIDTAVAMRNIHSIPLMRSKGDLSDVVDHDHYLSGDRIFKLLPGLDLSEFTDESVRSTLVRRFDEFKFLNTFVCDSNRIMPSAIRPTALPPSSPHLDSLWADVTARNLSIDQQFFLARTLAFQGTYEDARALCEHILMNSPNYHDVRMLLGRTYAWDGHRNTAREQYIEVQRRAPEYYDSYCAMADLHLWDGELDSAEQLIRAASARFPANEEVLLKEAQVLRRTGNFQKALAIVNRLLSKNPKNKEALAMKNALKP